MKKNYRYKFTYHMRERYLQRTRKKFKKLEDTHFLRKNPEKHRELYNQLITILRTKCREIDQEIFNKLENSSEVRTYLNNSNFMSKLNEKYGFDKKFKFMADKDVVFIVITEPDKGDIVVTCIESQNHIAGRIARRPKYSKKS